MNFKDENSEGELFYRKISEDGKIEIGVAPVLYGFRIRAGYVGSMCYELDYCCGADLKQVELIYSVVLSVLTRGSVPFSSFPMQETKPMINDPKCYMALILLMGNVTPVQVKTPNIHKMKSEYLKKVWA